MSPHSEADLASALRGSVVPLSIKTLKKKGVKRVKVIERERLMKLLEKTVERMLVDRGVATGTPGSSESPTERKRVELLLVELEKTARTKTQLEHEKGLIEAERSRLAAELERIAQEIGRGSGSKVKPEDVKGLLDELHTVREDRDKTRKLLDRTLREAEKRIEQESGNAKELARERDEALARVERLEGEVLSLVETRDALRARAVRLEEVEAEAARLGQEREKLAEKNLDLERDVARLRADLDAIRAAAEEAKAPAKAPEPPAPFARPTTSDVIPRRAAAAPSPAAGFGFGFGGRGDAREARGGGFASWSEGLKDR